MHARLFALLAFLSAGAVISAQDAKGSADIFDTPRGQATGVLTELNAMLAENSDVPARNALLGAIANLTDALEPSRWVDDWHLQPNHLGDDVFIDNWLAATALDRLANRREDLGEDVRRMQQELEELSRQLADEAGQDRGSWDHFVHWLTGMDNGDAAAAAGHSHVAIVHYRNAWNAAVHCLLCD